MFPADLHASASFAASFAARFVLLRPRPTGGGWRLALRPRQVPRMYRICVCGVREALYSVSPPTCLASLDSIITLDGWDTIGLVCSRTVQGVMPSRDVSGIPTTVLDHFSEPIVKDIIGISRDFTVCIGLGMACSFIS